MSPRKSREKQCSPDYQHIAFLPRSLLLSCKQYKKIVPILANKQSGDTWICTASLLWVPSARYALVFLIAIFIGYPDVKPLVWVGWSLSEWPCRQQDTWCWCSRHSGAAWEQGTGRCPGSALPWPRVLRAAAGTASREALQALRQLTQKGISILFRTAIFK